MTDGLVVRANKKGRGVYATRRFQKGELLCSAPVIIWPRAVVPDDFIWDYVWAWRRSTAVPLGLISMMNHATHFNATTQRLYAHRRMTCHARRIIQPGEEITIDYGAAADNFEIL